MSVRSSAAAAAAAAAVLCLASEFFERVHSWRRSTTHSYHVKCNSVLWHDLSQRGCVGRVIRCARQVLKARETDVQECNGAKSVCNSTLPLSCGWLCAQADYDAHCSILRRVLTNLLEHGCAIDQHDTGVQILVKVSFALHVVLKRSVMDSTGSFVDGLDWNNSFAQRKRPNSVLQSEAVYKSVFDILNDLSKGFSWSSVPACCRCFCCDWLLLRLLADVLTWLPTDC